MSYIIDRVDLNWIFIRETNQGISVTNNAENVTEEIYNTYGDYRILYRDSEGFWDELLHSNGRFTGFKLHTLNDNNYLSVVDDIPNYR